MPVLIRAAAVLTAVLLVSNAQSQPNVSSDDIFARSLGNFTAAPRAWSLQYRPGSGGRIYKVSPGVAAQMESDLVAVIDQIAPTVVSLFIKAPPESKIQGEPPGKTVDSGSGVLITSNGYIITNNHVIAAASNRVLEVLLSDNRKFTGVIVGTDQKTDLAVVKIEGEGFPFAVWGDSLALKRGRIVIAMGSPYGLHGTATVGVISALGRDINMNSYEDTIQTDAAVNPGNSGGGLFTLEGKLIGINSAIDKRGSGIAFAISQRLAQRVSQQIISAGKVVRGWIGTDIQELDANLKKVFRVDGGVLVPSFRENSPTAKAGLAVGDVILAIDGVPVVNVQDFREKVANLAPGTVIHLLIARKETQNTLKLTVGEQPLE
ncbi:MAG: trypsin-like peptidase domain-containing protein [Elusimicrobiota bacterium]